MWKRCRAHFRVQDYEPPPDDPTPGTDLCGIQMRRMYRYGATATSSFFSMPVFFRFAIAALVHLTHRAQGTDMM